MGLQDIRSTMEAVKAYDKSCREEILFDEFLQYEFQGNNWQSSSITNRRGISLIGHIPIIVRHGQ